MDKKENKINDYQEQYDVLMKEKEEKGKKKRFLTIFFCLVIILLSVLCATYSYYKIYINEAGKNSNQLNIDLDGDI